MLKGTTTTKSLLADEKPLTEEEKEKLGEIFAKGMAEYNRVIKILEDKMKNSKQDEEKYEAGKWIERVKAQTEAGDICEPQPITETGTRLTGASRCYWST